MSSIGRFLPIFGKVMFSKCLIELVNFLKSNKVWKTKYSSDMLFYSCKFSKRNSYWIFRKIKKRKKHCLQCTVLYCTVLYCTALYCTVLYCTVLNCTVLYYNILYCTVLYCTVLYCNILYSTVLYCTVVYCSVL